jgi:hypothetical protein
MKIQKDCRCCGAVYTVVFTETESDDEIEDSYDLGDVLDTDRIVEPIYCPFCGAYESEDEPTDFDEEVE